jgi:hypothetical protein
VLGASADVDASPAADSVPTVSTEDVVVPSVAMQGALAVAAEHFVVELGSLGWGLVFRLGAVAQTVVAGAAGEMVVSAVALERVVAVLPEKEVAAVLADQNVVSGCRRAVRRQRHKNPRGRRRWRRTHADLFVMEPDGSHVRQINATSENE